MGFDVEEVLVVGMAIGVDCVEGMIGVGGFVEGSGAVAEVVSVGVDACVDVVGNVVTVVVVVIVTVAVVSDGKVVG